MNKNSKKMKGFPKRLLAFMLCCFWLVATVPVSAAAMQTGESQITEESTLEQKMEIGSEEQPPFSSGSSESDEGAEEQLDISDEIGESVIDTRTEMSPVDALFERLMACEAYDELVAIMENLTDEEYALMAQFTDEQNTAMGMKVNKLGGYGAATLEEQSEEIDPDAAFIWVTKTFVGIDEIPSGFSISVGENQYDVAQAEKSTREDGSIVLKWRIPVAASASYQLKESGAEVDNYTLTADPSGILTEDGTEVSVDASRVTMEWKEDINECSNQVFALSDDHVFIVAAKKNVIVLSAAPLGVTARTAIINEIKTFSADFKHNNGDTVSFYQISQYLGQTITIGGTSVTVSEDGTTATIGATKEWTKVKNYQYGYEAAQSDISITNTYRPKVCDLTISKLVSGNMGDRNKEFSFTATLPGKGYSFGGVTYSIDDGETLNVDAADNSLSFTLKHGQSITLNGLPVGAIFAVTENIDGNEYVTTVDGEAGISKIITLAETNADILFENRKDVTVDTGVLLDTLPYILILGVVAVGAVLLIKKRRNRDDD